MMRSRDISLKEYVIQQTKATGILPCIKLHKKDDYIAYAQKLDVAVSKFLNDVLPTLIDNLDNQLSEYLDKMSDKGIKNISDELEKIMKIVKEDDNAEIIKGALKMGGDEY